MVFIQQFLVKEGHYCRKNTKRRYLSAELNMQKMYRLYLKSRAGTRFADNVKASYFRFAFVTKFNLGFSSLVTDAYSLCVSLCEWIRAVKGLKIIRLKIINLVLMMLTVL